MGIDQNNNQFKKDKLQRNAFAISEQFFMKVLFSVYFLIFNFALSRFLMGGQFSGYILISISSTVTFLCYTLYKKKYYNSSKLILLASSTFYIYTVQYGIPVHINPEYFYMPAMFIPLILFNPHEKKMIMVGMAIPLFGWLAFTLLPYPELIEPWIFDTFPTKLFQVVNFASAIGLTWYFLLKYQGYLKKYQILIEKELKYSRAMEERLRETQRIAKLGSWEVNPTTDVINISREMKSLFNVEGDELFMSVDEWKEKIKILNHAVIVDKMRNAISEKKSLEFLESIKVDGMQKEILFKIHPLFDQNGDVLKVMGTVQDLTEQKKIEKLVAHQQSQILASSKMVALGEMASGVAHEINNPLSIISARSSLLLESIKNGEVPSREKLISDLTKIMSTTERVGKIVKGLRTFARTVENDPIEIVNFSNSLEEILSLTKEKFFKYGIAVNSQIEPNIQIECQSAQLGQVFINLINNAFDAVLELPEKWIEVNMTARDGWMVLWVTDSGKGIDPLVVEKMMNPFFTTKEIGKGTGLGLSSSLGIIMTHHGRLYYDQDSPNTRFIVEVPLLQPLKIEKKSA